MCFGTWLREKSAWGLRRLWQEARHRLGRGVGLHRASLDDLVKLATVQPDTATTWAVIDLDPLPLGHD